MIVTSALFVFRGLPERNLKPLPSELLGTIFKYVFILSSLVNCWFFRLAMASALTKLLVLPCNSSTCLKVQSARHFMQHIILRKVDYAAYFPLFFG